MKTTFSVLLSGLSGVAGDVVAATWKGISYVRARVIPHNPQSAAQTLQREAWARVVDCYQHLPVDIKAGLDVLGSDEALAGFNIYMRENVPDERVSHAHNIFPANRYAEPLAGMKPGFEIACTVTVNVHEDVKQALVPVKMAMSFYIGGMGAASQNFHLNLIKRMGFEAEAERMQELFLAGKRAEAMAAVPDSLCDEISLCGPPDRIRERLEAWKSSPVTTLIAGTRDPATLRLLADCVR